MTKTKSCHCCQGTGTELDSVAIGRELRNMRTSRQVTLLEVARHMKFTPAYISDLERGKRNWNEELVRKFKKAVGA